MLSSAIASFYCLENERQKIDATKKKKAYIALS